MAPSMIFSAVIFLLSSSVMGSVSTKAFMQIHTDGRTAVFSNVRRNLTRKEALRKKHLMEALVRSNSLVTDPGANPALLPTVDPTALAAIKQDRFEAKDLGTAPDDGTGVAPAFADPPPAMPASFTLDGKPLLVAVAGLQVHKVASTHRLVTSHPLAVSSGTDIEYVAVDINGVPQYALTKVSDSTARFYDVNTGQRIALVQEESGLTSTQFNILGYVPECVTQVDAHLTDAAQGFKTFLRYTLAKGALSSTWTTSRSNCDSAPGDAVWEIEVTSGFTDLAYNYDVRETASQAPKSLVGFIKELYAGMWDASAPATSERVYNVWLGLDQDQALGVLVAMLVDYARTGALSSATEEQIDAPLPTPAVTTDTTAITPPAPTDTTATPPPAPAATADTTAITPPAPADTTATPPPTPAATAAATAAATTAAAR